MAVGREGHHTKPVFENEIKTDITELKTSFSNFNFTNISTEEILQKPDVARTLFQYRYLVTLLGFFIFSQLNFYRMATTISLVAMVKTSNSSNNENLSSNIVSCPINSEYEEKLTDSTTEGEFDWSADLQGYILSAGFLGYVLTQIPSGILSETYGAKITIVSGLTVSAIAHLVSPPAARYSGYLLIIVQLVRGAAQGLLLSAYSVIASNWIPSIERGLLNSIILAGIPAGAVISGFSAGALCASSFLGGWPSAYYLFGVIGLVQCILVQAFLYESPKIHPGITEKEKNYILYYQESDLKKKRPPTPWKKISRSIPVYAMTYALFGAYWAAGHLQSIHPLFLGTMMHFSLVENGLITSITFIIQIVISFITSFISDWLSKHNFVGVNKLRKGINLLACLGYSLGLLGMYYAECDSNLSNLLSIIGMSFNGFVFGGCMIIAMDMSPTFAGTLTGLTSTVASSASFILPVVHGNMIQKEESLGQWNNIYFLSIAVLMSSGIVFCVFGSAEVQPWNFVSDDSKGNNYSTDDSCDKKTEETDISVETAVHF